MARKPGYTKVVLSSFELTTRRKPKGKVCTARQAAAAEFKPWKLKHPPGQPGPSAELFYDMRVAARLAAGIMEQPKSRLVGMFDCENNHEGLMETTDWLFDMAERMKELVYMIEAAHTRMLVAASAYVVAGSKAPPA